MSLMKEKMDYLTRVWGIEFVPKKKHNYDIKCELCERKIFLEISGTTIVRPHKAEYHHDQNRVLHLYCYECHKRIHDWGVIQKWLKKINKTVDDLPDSIGLNPIWKFVSTG